MNRAAVALAAAMFAAPSPSTSAQSSLPTLSYGTVSVAAFDWPELVAQRLGFFAADGIAVEVIRTGSSAANAQQLVAGSLDVAECSSSQAIEAIAGGAPIVAIQERVAAAPYFVMGRKGLTSIAQLKGKSIIVGGPNDITRVFMDKVLAGAHLGPDDYTYLFAGATDARFAALVSGSVDAAILSPPISTRAADQGYPDLADVAKYFPQFPFDVFAVRTAWAAQHRDLLVAFTKAHIQGVRWLADPVNRARAIQLLSDDASVSVDDATKSYDLFITDLRAFPPTGAMRDADVLAVIDALVTSDQVKPPLPPPSRFYDDSFVNAALAQLRSRSR